MWTIGFLIVLSLALGAGAWLFFIWSAKSGQYDDPEGPKHRMLEDEEDSPRPRASRAGQDAGPRGRSAGN